MTALAMQLPIAFEKPEWLWLALLAPAIVVASWRPLASLGPVRRVLALGVRCLVILVITAALADVQRVRRNEDITVMFLMDRSLSVREHTDAQEVFMEEVSRNAPPDDRIGVIDFARMAFLEQLPMRGGYFLERGRLPEMAFPDRTDVAAAIRLAMAMMPHDTGKRIVLMSDGNDNMGDVIGEAQRAASDGVTIDVVPLWYRIGSEVFFEKMVAPSTADRGEVVPIRMTLNASGSTTGRVDVYHNDVKLALPDEVARVALVPGVNSFVLRVPIDKPGAQKFDAQFIPDDGAKDTIIDNNRATAFTFVSARGQVAILSLRPSDDEPLLEALLSENVDATLLDVSSEMPDFMSLLDYAAIILANVPANEFTDEQQERLAAYVEDLGGGLIMTGGDESFGAGGWIDTPVAEVLPVELEIKHKKILPRGALALIMHSCEFPRANMWSKLIAKKAVDTISSRDYIGVLAYAAGGESWEVPLQIARNKEGIKAAIDRMYVGDMPDFDTTIKMAVEAMVQTDAAQKHIIIISDGDASPPSGQVIQALNDNRITVSTVAVGFGAHAFPAPMQDIARQTNGRYYKANRPRELPQIFVKESKIVRRPLIIDKAFKPQVFYSLSDVLPGVRGGEIPELGGLILTSPKPLAQIALVRATEDGNDPVLAHWQRGLGRSVAFTSGMWPKWGARWTGWSTFSKLWAQIVRWTMRQEAPANFDVYTTTEGNQARIVIEALDKNADYLNFLNLQSTVILPEGGKKSLEFTQTGPGHYEAVFDIEQTGQYITNVAVFEEGEYKGSMHTGVAMPFSPELRELSTNEAMLRRVAEITGGRFLDDADPATAPIFAHDLPPTESLRSAWDWAVAWLLLPLFLLDVAARRLASWLALSIVVELVILVVLLFGAGVIYTHWWGVLGVFLLAELVGWSIRFRYIRPLYDWLTHSVTALGTAGERSAASLSQLKGVRDRVREERGASGGSAESRRAAGDAAPKTDARARFDAGKPTEGTIGDISASLGGAEAGPESQSVGKQGVKPSGAGKESKDSEQDMTSRLLAAKRRARQSRKKDDESDQK